MNSRTGRVLPDVPALDVPLVHAPRDPCPAPVAAMEAVPRRLHG